jgi:hypothetical protein
MKKDLLVGLSQALARELNNREFINSIDIDTHGTYLQGYVETTYDELVKRFGEPTSLHKNDKINCEWCLKFNKHNGEEVIATIYDWKVDETPKDLYEWHIGGFTKSATSMIASHYNTLETTFIDV